MSSETNKLDENKLDKKEVSKIYGINLENIEQIQTKNKEFFKFTDNSGNIKIIENIQNDFNLSEQFKSAQANYSFAQSSDELNNAENLFNFEQKYNRRELKLVDVSELCYEKEGKIVLTYAFEKLSANLNEIQKFEIKQLLKVSKIINLKYVNIENGIGVDNQNRVISSTYNALKKNCDIDLARVLKFENDVKNVDSNSKEIDLNSIDYESIVTQLEVANDTPIEVLGESISKGEVDNYYNYPELLDQNDKISKTKKSIITRLLEVLRIRKEKTNTNDKQKQKVYTNTKNTMQNLLFIISLTAFISGAIYIFVI